MRFAGALLALLACAPAPPIVEAPTEIPIEPARMAIPPGLLAVIEIDAGGVAYDLEAHAHATQCWAACLRIAVEHGLVEDCEELCMSGRIDPVCILRAPSVGSFASCISP